MRLPEGTGFLSLGTWPRPSRRSRRRRASSMRGGRFDGPDARNGAELVERLDAWLGEAVAPDDTLSTFIRDNELAWLRGTVPAECF